MEANKQLAQHNSLHNGSTDSNTASDSDESTISNLKIGTKPERQGRKPTRRPNPNVQNRNALLARENRRKKKEHLEAMEKELEEVRATNKRLKKALKQKMKTVDQLEREKRYFQSILANHKEIENLIKALNVRMHVKQLSPTAKSPMLSSPAQSHCSQHKLYGATPNDLFQQLDSLDDDGCKNGSCGKNVNTSEHSENDLASSGFNDTWSDLLDEDNIGTKDLTQLTTVVNEHSYAEVGLMPTPPSTDTDAGICLHIRQGKISLEFCPSCNWNSNDFTVANSTF